MKQLLLNDIKERSQIMLKEFKRICKEHDITFYLSNGTLLGAVKYGGFIPWDDDVDVLVPRQDYDRLMQVFQDTDKYQLFSIERNPDYGFPFAKFCDRETVKEEHNIDNGVEMGLSIDVFPLDVCTEHMCGFWPQLKMKLLILQLTLAKLIAFDDKVFYKKWIIRYCKKRGIAHFNQKILKLVKKESAKGNTHCGRLTWPLLGEKEMIPLSVFSETAELTFEGESYPVPSRYDLYLRTLYGDCTEDLPLEEQVSHHSYTAYLKDN